MGFEFDSSDENRDGSLSNCRTLDVQAIVKVAHEELLQLIQQRAEIMQRMGTIKQTIVGLCKLFGDHELSDDLRELVNGKAGIRRPGITQACRTVLMEARCPVTARDICEQIQRRTTPGVPSSKNQVASVTTVLNRLVQYGEARTVPRDNGPRAWLWVSRSGVHPVDSTSHALLATD
jgi:hypothetical protein